MTSSYISENKLNDLKNQLNGNLHFDALHKTIYATDASAYSQIPAAVAFPANTDDIKKLIKFATENKISLVPRTAGTSLAGQVVGEGIIADVSKHFTDILEVNTDEKWVRVQPGVVLDELNKHLQHYNLFFGPETSTANRCMIGGMAGNNACGAHSLIYGSTRDHLLEAKVILSDGSEATFGKLSKKEFEDKMILQNFEGTIYRTVFKLLSAKGIQHEIEKEFPEKSVKRRNTGYAVDLLIQSSPFQDIDKDFNFCNLIAGSEGTLAFITELKLNLVSAPPKEKAVIPVHLNSLEDALYANLIALKYNPGAVELMDKTILDCTKGNLEQNQNRFFIKGDPGAVLIVEFARQTKEEIHKLAEAMESEMKQSGYGYHFPVIFGSDTNKVWNLRKAGLGVLSNIEGDAKPVSVIEDTAINPEKLPAYIAEFKQMLAKYKLDCVYHAHIGTGELHLRPILNLKDKKDVELFRTVANETALLVKKYNGSLSGEHGDGRLRGEFIPLMVGQRNYELLKKIKNTFDPNNIFNPGKIVDTPAMNTHLRYDAPYTEKKIETIFDFSENHGIVKAIEKCNGSSDCKKSHIIGGTMCPSYQATKDERHVTRSRANALREFIANSTKKNPFDNPELYEILDLCLSCKACKTECPSSIDMTKLKAEFLQHYYDANGVPLRSRVIANFAKLNKVGIKFSSLTNYLSNTALAKRVLKISPHRKLPKLAPKTLSSWFRNRSKNENKTSKTVYFFIDEFTQFNDVETGKKAVLLLEALGYEVKITENTESGRTYLSKGLVRKAKQIAKKNIAVLSQIITDETPLIGIEPSAVLTFRDEYPDLFAKDEKGVVSKERAINLAKNVLMIDEFIARELEKGTIDKNLFTTETKEIKLHGHCQQKALTGTAFTKKMLTLPANYKVSEIPSGCCGMAGSFGYEAEHYEISMKIGELVLFPEIRKSGENIEIAAPGTSCRHQIADGTQRKALHPVEILYEALLKK